MSKTFIEKYSEANETYRNIFTNKTLLHRKI